MLPIECDIELLEVTWGGHSINYTVRVFDRHFNCDYTYNDVCFSTLSARYGKDCLEGICFHIIAFEMAKYCSLAPNTIGFGPLSHHCTPQFKTLWLTVFKNVWGQWRYEHDRPDYNGPCFIDALAKQPFNAIEERDQHQSYLLFGGGGKDSLCAMKTLDGHHVSYGAFSYSHSVYGSHALQLALSNEQVAITNNSQLHTLAINDDFLDGSSMPKKTAWPPRQTIHTLLHAETPCSIFAVLPVVLMHGYQSVVLAHERSADFGNLIWKKTGEEINHQWGKSWQAERLLNHYVRQNLIASFHYFSVLKPLTDVLIFQLLSENPLLISTTHSCNEKKPWCKRCAKCAYVWLNFKAYFPEAVVDTIFGEDLFDNPINLLWFRQMLGLEDHTPFECVGQVGEARLALHFYRQNNTHTVADSLYDECKEDWPTLIQTLTQLDFHQCNLPDQLAMWLRPYFVSQAEKAKASLQARHANMAQLESYEKRYANA